MTRELKCVGMAGRGGFARVTREGSIFRVYHGRTPESEKVRYTVTHEADAYALMRRCALTKSATLDYLEAVQ